VISCDAPKLQVCEIKALIIDRTHLGLKDHEIRFLQILVLARGDDDGGGGGHENGCGLRPWAPLWRQARNEQHDLILL